MEGRDLVFVLRVRGVRYVWFWRRRESIPFGHGCGRWKLFERNWSDIEILKSESYKVKCPTEDVVI
jgi:hypothetical protein